MRILIISHMYPNTFNPVAGVFVQRQAEALHELGVDVTIISPVPWAPGPVRFYPKWARYAEIPRETVMNDIPVYYPRVVELPRSLGFQFYGDWYYTSMKNLAMKLHTGHPFDLIHAHVALPDGIAAQRLAEAVGVPWVVTIHGQDFFHTIYRNQPCRRQVQQVLDKASRVILVSSKLDKLARQENLLNTSAKTEIVPNGVNLEQTLPRENPLKKQYAGSKVLLSVGYLIKRKGHKYVLDALAGLVHKFPTLRYLIVGDGEELTALREQVKTLGLERNIEFLGRCSHEEVMQYMDLCDIFVLPSWDEAFGVVYVEAMAQARPVIGCRGEGIEDFVTPGVNGFLAEPQDATSLGGILDQLLSNPEQAKAVGQAARATVEQRYTWAKCAEQLLNIYRSLA